MKGFRIRGAPSLHIAELRLYYADHRPGAAAVRRVAVAVVAVRRQRRARCRYCIYPRYAAPAVLWLSTGNPGLSEYYAKFLSAMYHSKELEGRCAILCVTLLGHGRTHEGAAVPTGERRVLCAKKPYYTVADQVQLQERAVAALKEAYAQHRFPVLLMGHSFGAYVAMQLFAKQLPDVTGMQLLFPALSEMHATPQGQRLALLFAPVVSFAVMYLTMLLCLLPTAWHESLVRCFTRMSAGNAAITTTFLRRPDSVYNAVSMGADEMRVIKEFSEPVKLAAADAEKRNQTIRTYWGTKDTVRASEQRLSYAGLLGAVKVATAR